MAEDISRGAVMLVLVLTIVVSALSTVIVWEKATNPVSVTKISPPGSGQVSLNVESVPKEKEPSESTGQVGITIG
ncbi:hypothetical protein ACFL0W_06355 [Nanoarchaeota archaeon]